MTDPAIVLICHKASFGYAMAAALRHRFGDGFAGVLAIDRRPSRRQRLSRYLSRVLTTPSLERRVRRLEHQLGQEAERVFLAEASPPDDWPEGVPVHLTTNPNDAASVSWLSQRTPDIIAVTGAPILRAQVFDLARLGTLNMHSSLLPAYRGTQAEFWQLLEDRRDTCGVTIHFIDGGVDTGNIVLQRATPANEIASPQMLRTYNLLAALETVPEAIAHVLDNSAEPRPQGRGDAAKRGRDKTLARRAQLLTKLGYGNFQI